MHLSFAPINGAANIYAFSRARAINAQVSGKENTLSCFSGRFTQEVSRSEPAMRDEQQSQEVPQQCARLVVYLLEHDPNYICHRRVIVLSVCVCDDALMGISGKAAASSSNYNRAATS